MSWRPLTPAGEEEEPVGGGRGDPRLHHLLRGVPTFLRSHGSVATAKVWLARRRGRPGQTDGVPAEQDRRIQKDKSFDRSKVAAWFSFHQVALLAR